MFRPTLAIIRFFIRKICMLGMEPSDVGTAHNTRLHIKAIYHV